jgi:hypothetical protein
MRSSIVALVLTATSTAWAQTDRGTPPEPPSKPAGFETGFGVEAVSQGGFVDGDGGGMLVGATFLFRQGPLVLGFVAERSMMFDATNTYAGVAGVSARAGRFRTKLLASAGTHEYVGVGGSLFGSDPGVNGSVGFVGGRLMPSYRFFSGPTHLELGALVLYEADLSRRTVHYTYTDTQDDWLFGTGGGSVEQEGSHTIGGNRYGFAVSVGVSHDVF